LSCLAITQFYLGLNIEEEFLRDVLFDVSFTSATGSPSYICSLASRSERLGFRSVWMAHDLLWDNAWVICGAIARSTSKVLLGPGIVNPYSSSLPEIAMASASLDNLSDGRCLLGIGPGARLMLEDARILQTNVISRLGEAVAYLREALKPDSKVLRTGLTRRIPLFVGCQSPRLLEHIGRWQVGALPLLTPPSYAKTAMDAIVSGAKKVGKGVRRSDLIASILVSLSRDKEAALERFAKFITSILVHLSPYQLGAAGVHQNEVTDLLRDYSEKGWTAMPEKVFKLGATDIESCTRALEEVSRAGFTRVKCGSPLGPDEKEAMNILAKKIFPHFKD